MILLELALQGIRGFPPLARITLRPGMNVGKSQDPIQRRAILDAIYHVLYPDPSRAGATAKLADPAAKEARFALTFFGRDRLTYRVVREAVTGAVSLHKFDPEQNKYAAMTRTALEAAQYLRVQQQLPDEVGYERLFVFSPEAMPSHGLKAKTRSGSQIAAGLSEGSVASGPGLPVSSPLGRPSNLAQARPPSQINSLQAMRGPSGFGSSLNMTNAIVQAEIARSGGDVQKAPGAATLDEGPDLAERIAEIREALERARQERTQVVRAEAAQVEIDALNQRRFEISTRVDRAKALRAEVERLQEHSRANADLRSLPKGFHERLRNLEEAKTKYQHERQKLVDERIELDQRYRQEMVLPLSSDRYFLSGVLLAVLFIVLAILMAKPALALLNVLCMVVAAGAAFRWVGEMEHHTRIGLRLQAAKDREQRLDRQYDQDTSALRRLLEKLEISDPLEVVERIEGAMKVENQLEIAEDALRRELADPQTAEADRELAHIARRIEALEGDTVSVQSVLSAETLDRRVVQLERELAELQAQEKARSRGISPPPPRSVSRPAAALTPHPSQRPPSVPAAPPPERTPPVPPRPPTREAEQLFDFGGGNIGSDDDEEGYGSGYGTGSGRPSGGNPGSGSGASSGYDGEGLLAAPSLGGRGGIGSGGGTGSIDSYDLSGSGNLLAPDRSRDLFQTAVDLLQLPVDDLAARIQKRVGQYLLVFTDEAFDSAIFGPRGEMAVTPKGGGEPVGFMEIASDKIDLVDAALRFSLVEACVAKFKIPLLFDDPFLSFEAQKRVLLSQMLSYLAKMTQVFLLTERDDVAGNEVRW
jgi:hypothetical protein